MNILKTSLMIAIVLLTNFSSILVPESPTQVAINTQSEMLEMGRVEVTPTPTVVSPTPTETPIVITPVPESQHDLHELPTDTQEPTPTDIPTEVPTPTLPVLPYPEYITVRVTGHKECEAGLRYKVVEVPFKDYVKGVMMNEFGVQHWTYGADGERDKLVPHSDETLKTAAMVIKNYALHWFYRGNGGKWGGYEYGIVYDCDWDMVYNPNITNPRTDQAVEDTWNLVILDEYGEYKETNFLALPATCDWFFGVGKCLGAWQYGGIFQQGDRGWTMEEMLHDAYHDITIVDLYEEVEHEREQDVY